MNRCSDFLLCGIIMFRIHLFKEACFQFQYLLFKKICLPCGTRRCFFSPDALCSMHLYTPNNYPRPPGCFPDNCCNKDLFCFIFMDDTIINLKEFKVRAKRQTLSVTGLIISNKKCVPLMMSEYYYF